MQCCAVGKGGISKHSQPTQPMVAKSRKEAPKITLSSELKALLGIANKLSLKAGSPFKLEGLDATGDPVPKVTWLCEGVDLTARYGH